MKNSNKPLAIYIVSVLSERKSEAIEIELIKHTYLEESKYFM